jgi:hypothetical protein
MLVDQPRLIIGAILVAFTIAIAVFVHLTFASPVPARFGLGFARLQATRMENFYSHDLRGAMVTNAGPYQLGLDMQSLQWEENGIVVTTSAVVWGGRNYDSSLAPSGVMPLPFEIPTNSPRFRVSFYYSRAAGFPQRVASRTIRKHVRAIISPRLKRLCMTPAGSTGVFISCMKAFGRRTS